MLWWVVPLLKAAHSCWQNFMFFTHCWWFRHPARKPVEVGSLSHCFIIYLQGFIHLNWCRISETSTVFLRKIQQTPGTSPRYPKYKSERKSKTSTGGDSGLEYVPGVCWNFLKNIGSSRPICPLKRHEIPMLDLMMKFTTLQNKKRWSLHVGKEHYYYP